MTGQPDQPERGIAAAILAGGRNSRFGGKLKGLQEVRPGLSIIDREIRKLSAAGIRELTIVANDPEAYRHCGPPIISDLRPGLGPLGGIEAALAHHADTCEATLFLPCDLPAITQHEIRTLVEGFAGTSAMVVLAAHIYWEPLCTVVHNSLLATITKALDDGERSPAKLWRELDALPIHFDDATPFFNVNTPHDLAHWQQRRQERDA